MVLHGNKRFRLIDNKKSPRKQEVYCEQYERSGRTTRSMNPDLFKVPSPTHWPIVFSRMDRIIGISAVGGIYT